MKSSSSAVIAVELSCGRVRKISPANPLARYAEDEQHGRIGQQGERREASQAERS